MSEENINRLDNEQKQYVSLLVSKLENAGLIRLLIRKKIITESEMHPIYDAMKLISYDDFRKSIGFPDNNDYSETVYNAYLETVELARETALEDPINGESLDDKNQPDDILNAGHLA